MEKQPLEKFKDAVYNLYTNPDYSEEGPFFAYALKIMSRYDRNAEDIYCEALDQKLITPTELSDT